MSTNRSADTETWEAPETFADDPRVDTERVAPSRTDPIVEAASDVVGGPVGRHAVIGRSRYWTPLRVVFALALCTLALGWFGKAGCLQQAPADANSTGSSMRLDWDDQRQYTNLCYSDVIGLFGAEKLDQGEFPYSTYWYEEGPDGQQGKRYMEYPVLTGLYMYGAAWVARAWESAHEKWGVPGALAVVLFFDLVALGLALFWLVTIWATALTARTRIWATWMAALSPLVIVHIFTNFDAIAMAMVALAILSWSRRKPWLAGVFIGLGTAAKLYPVLLLVVLLVLCLRAGKVREFVQAAACALGVWVAVNLPILIMYPRGWWEFFRYNADRAAESDSLYRVISDAAGFRWDPGALNALSLALLVLVAVGVGAVALTAPQRPRVAQLAFLMVAGFLLVNKVWSPQYSLWLVPLAVLAIPHTRLLFAWMVIDALVWIPRMSLYLDPERRWLPDQWFTAIIVVRALMVIALCVVVLWQIWNPADDLIRRGSRARGDVFLDDPAGGVLDGAPDRLAYPAGRRTSRPLATATAFTPTATAFTPTATTSAPTATASNPRPPLE
ncbi:glycosyltransferase 87 family protein [Gordonia sp. CPCC 206044]|uniref:glycosyltransferase family 87 protein n=1 Tax=Gordonia sp. CPCC 206044 TaxID=3140793 RepID=UPI003AF3B19A